MDGPGTPPTAKGGKTRARILRAAQLAVAELGVAGVSHRAIAARAGVKLSLTSYYFGSLDQLLEAAWDDQRARSYPLGQAMRDDSAAIAEALRQSTDPRDRARHVHALAALFAGYIADEVRERPEDLAADCSFLFAWTLPPGLREKVARHNQAWVDRAAQMLALAGSRDPAIDAETLVAAVRHCEFSQATFGRDSLSEAAMTKRFRRLLSGMVPNVADPDDA